MIRLYEFFALVILLMPTVSYADRVEQYLFADSDALMPRKSHTGMQPASSWIENPEIRIRPSVQAATQGSKESQLYGFRFRPTSRAERRATTLLSDTWQAQTNLADHPHMNTLLGQRYRNLIKLADKEMAFSTLLAELKVDRSIVASAQSLSDTGLSNARLQAAVLRMELREQAVVVAEAQLNRLRQDSVGNRYSTSTLSISDLLATPRQIKALLNKIDTELHGYSRTSMALLKVNEARADLSLEESQSGFGLQLIELRDEDQQFDAYGVTLGFRLPQIGQGSRHNKQRLALVEAEQQLFATTLNLEAEKKAWHQTIEQSALVYETHQPGVASTQARLEKPPQDPWAIEILHRHQLRQQSLVNQAHVQALEADVALLESAGLLPRSLSNESFTNWIEVVPDE